MLCVAGVLTKNRTLANLNSSSSGLSLISTRISGLKEALKWIINERG